MLNQPLRGFVGQSMVSRKVSFAPFSRTFTPNASVYSWVVPANGTYEVAGWSCGNVYNGVGAATGAFGLKTVQLSAGQVLSIRAGLNGFDAAGAGAGSGAATDTVVTFPGGATMTLTHASPSTGAAGTATGGDVNIDGSTGGAVAIAGPSYASAYNTYAGGGVSGNRGATPAGASNTSGGFGADGLVIVNRIA